MDIWHEIGLNEISGVRIGHAQDDEHGTGCTVIIPEDKAVCGVDIRGGGPASRETQLLNPMMKPEGVKADHPGESDVVKEEKHVSQHEEK